MTYKLSLPEHTQNKDVILCIKSIRTLFNLSLREAKDMVDRVNDVSRRTIIINHPITNNKELLQGALRDIRTSGFLLEPNGTINVHDRVKRILIDVLNEENVNYSVVDILNDTLKKLP